MPLRNRDKPRSGPSTAGLSPLSGRAWRPLVAPYMLWMAWLPVLVIGLVHYATDPHHYWAHDILRRLYYLPILFGAFSHGWRGGLAVALVASLTYAPHAFFVMEASQDPGTTLNKLLEIVLYNLIGAIAGVLADREAERRRQAERAFAEQQRMADQLVRAGRLAALGELVAGVAHELKNPLHTIKGTAEIVDEIIPQNAEQAKMWHLLRQEVDRLERTAEHFLSFARPSKPRLGNHSFAGVYGHICELVKAQVHGAPGIRLQMLPLDDSLAELRMRVDPDQLAQIALNITSNALRATQGTGTIRIQAGLRNGDNGQWVLLRIENSGPSIPEADMERIFDPFFSHFTQGTGLGLAIAQRIAEGQGGFLEVENTGPTRGVAFCLVLPHS